MYTHVIFADPSSARMIPGQGCTFHITAAHIEERPGGPGLDEIKHLLYSAERDDTFEFSTTSSIDAQKSAERVIGARISRTRMLFIVPFTYLFYQREKKKLLS